MPLLWRGTIVAWANAAVRQGRLEVRTGHLSGRPPRGKAYLDAVQAEAQALAGFLGLGTEAQVTLA